MKIANMGAPTDAPPPYPDGEKADSPSYTEGTAYPPLLQQGYPQMGQLPQAQQPAPGYSAQQPAPGHQDSDESDDEDDDDVNDPPYCLDDDQPPQQNMRCGRRKLRDYVSDSEDSDEDCSDSNGVLQRLANLRCLREGNYKKPRRTCPFCSKSYSEKLARHIGNIHRHIPQVAAALKLPKKEMDEAFSKMRKEGILMVNKEKMKSRTPVFERERNTASNQPLVMCGLCKGFYVKKCFSRHKIKCQGDSCEEACTIPVSLLMSETTNQNKLLSEFSVNILYKFRGDEVGSICREDPVILNVGKRLWDKGRAKENKKTEVRKSVMSDMRRLASLYLHFKEQKTIHASHFTLETGTSRDMFDRKNFSILSEAINAYTLNKEKASIKSGLKLGIYYLLKKASKVIKATHLVEENDIAAADIDRFVSVLELNQNFLFGDASYQINMNRQKNLRKPAALPLEEDINKLRSYTVATLNSMMNDDFIIWDSHNFKKLRDLTVTRLTLFNARRGGEPSRLSLDEWRQASCNAWIDKQKAEAIQDPVAKHLLNELKVTYQSGKGNNHLVPVLFPGDCIKPMETLTSKETRSTACIRQCNPYVFACTQGSNNHVSGWHALNGVCDDAGIDSTSNLTATKNRHRISTIYASLEIPEKERALFFKHMGHSADINENIYQAPAAIMEVVRVGKQLQQIDKANPSTQNDEYSSDGAENSSANPSTQNDEYSSDGAESSSSDSQAGTILSSEAEYHVQRGCKRKHDAGKVKSGRKYTRWNQKDTAQVLKYFKGMITGTQEKTIPGRHDVEVFLKKCRLSTSYDCLTIRSKVMNERNKWHRLNGLQE
ncbi:uncharacterized protein [Apostichopus japonicus]|uniref:uncharacterized protein isoform X1 n=1 Tax=Stichopus japonicus TaxID=307972 RepID=UPI003AB83B10